MGDTFPFKQQVVLSCYTQKKKKQLYQTGLENPIQFDILTYSDGVSVALVVDAEPPKALVGGAARVPILHPEICCCGNDEKHEGGHAAERASSRQRVEHGVEAGGRTVLLNFQQLFREERDASCGTRLSLMFLIDALAFTESGHPD